MISGDPPDDGPLGIEDPAVEGGTDIQKEAAFVLAMRYPKQDFDLGHPAAKGDILGCILRLMSPFPVGRASAVRSPYA